MSSLFEESSLNSIKNRIANLTADSKAKWGKMNVGQMLCHVNDGFKMATGKLSVEDKSNFINRTLFKFLVLNVIRIPRDVPTAKELDQMRDGTPPEEFEKDKAAVLASIDEMVALPADFAWAPHLRFGPMTRNEWGKMGFKHLDHHLRQFGV